MLAHNLMSPSPPDRAAPWLPACRGMGGWVFLADCRHDRSVGSSVSAVGTAAGRALFVLPIARRIGYSLHLTVERLSGHRPTSRSFVLGLTVEQSNCRSSNSRCGCPSALAAQSLLRHCDSSMSISITCRCIEIYLHTGLHLSHSSRHRHHRSVMVRSNQRVYSSGIES